MSRLPVMLMSVAVVAICIGLNVHRYPMAWEYMRLTVSSLNRTTEVTDSMMDDHTQSVDSVSLQKVSSGLEDTPKGTAVSSSVVSPPVLTSSPTSGTASTAVEASGIAPRESQQVRRISFPEDEIAEIGLLHVPATQSNVSVVELPVLTHVEEGDDASYGESPVEMQAISPKVESMDSHVEGHSVPNAVGEEVPKKDTPATNVTSTNDGQIETDRSTEKLAGTTILSGTVTESADPMESTSVVSAVDEHDVAVGGEDESSIASVTRIVEADERAGIETVASSAQTALSSGHVMRQHRVLRTSKTQTLPSPTQPSVSDGSRSQIYSDTQVVSKETTASKETTEPLRSDEPLISEHTESCSSVIWHSSDTPLTRQRIREMLTEPSVETPPTSDP